MRIRKYILMSLIFVLSVGAFVHFEYERDLTIDLFGNSVMLPISMWVSLPLFALFFASVFHMMYYSAKGYFKKLSLKKDHKNLVETVKKALLAEKTNYVFKNEQYKTLGTLLSNSKIVLQDLSIKTGIAEFDSIIDIQKDMNEHKGVNLKSYSLSENNEFRIQNIKNKIFEDIKFAKDVLRNNTSYTQDVLRMALEKVIDSKNENDIKNGIKNVVLDKHIAFMLIDLYNQELHITYEELKSIVIEANFSSMDYIELSKKLKIKIIPDELIKLFNNLSDDIENAKEAYIYVLFDLEMLQLAREYLENIDTDELVTFRAYLTLKDSGHDYNLDNLIKGIY